MLGVRHLVLIALVTACWAGPARSVEPEEKKELGQPWWAVARAGGYTFQSMYGSSVGYLMPVDGPPGGISLGVQEDLLVGVGAGRWFYRWLSVELALSRFDVELGGDDLLEETGGWHVARYSAQFSSLAIENEDRRQAVDAVLV